MKRLFHYHYGAFDIRTIHLDLGVTGVQLRLHFSAGGHGRRLCFLRDDCL